jgi:hypothetical protein
LTTKRLDGRSAVAVAAREFKADITAHLGDVDALRARLSAARTRAATATPSVALVGAG